MNSREQYLQVEAKRGAKSFNPRVSAVWRGEPCCLTRHFKKNTVLRAMAFRIEQMAKRDSTGQRFIYEKRWNSLRKAFSQSAIDRAERIFEGAGVLFPTRAELRGRMVDGWIVIDHDKNRTIVDGKDCVLNIALNAVPPRRKRGERRWKSVPAQCDRNANAFPETPGERAQSPLQSPFPKADSPLQSPFKSPFHLGEESISDASNATSNQGLTNHDSLKIGPEVNEVNEVKKREVIEVTEHQPHTLSFSKQTVDKTAPSAHGQEKKLTYSTFLSDVNSSALEAERFADIVGHATRGRIELERLKRYEHCQELAGACVEVVESLSAEAWPAPPDAAFARIMGRVMDVMNERGLKVPTPWVACLSDVRRSVQSA